MNDMSVGNAVDSKRLPKDLFELSDKQSKCPLTGKLLCTMDASNRIEKPVFFFDGNKPQVYEKSEIIQQIVQGSFSKLRKFDSVKCDILRTKVDQSSLGADSYSNVDLKAEGLRFNNLIELADKITVINHTNLDDMEQYEVPKTLVVTTCCCDGSQQPVLRIYNQVALKNWLLRQNFCTICSYERLNVKRLSLTYSEVIREITKKSINTIRDVKNKTATFIGNQAFVLMFFLYVILSLIAGKVGVLWVASASARLRFPELEPLTAALSLMRSACLSSVGTAAVVSTSTIVGIAVSSVIGVKIIASIKMAIASITIVSAATAGIATVSGIDPISVANIVSVITGALAGVTTVWLTGFPGKLIGAAVGVISALIVVETQKRMIALEQLSTVVIIKKVSLAVLIAGFAAVGAVLAEKALAGMAIGAIVGFFGVAALMKISQKLMFFLMLIEMTIQEHSGVENVGEAAIATANMVGLTVLSAIVAATLCVVSNN
jgi:hypothetical protein